MQNLSGKVALITGGTKGIGYGIAQALLSQGAKVAITSRSLDRAQKAALELTQNGGDVLPLAADARAFESQELAVKHTIDAYGHIDILIANAGLGHFKAIDQLSVEEWDETIATNLSGVFYTIKAGIAALKKSKGYIFTISSLAGTNFFAGGTAYNASKFGVTGFTQALMLDVRQDDVKVTTIMPGSVSTHFNGGTPDESEAWQIQPEDLGQMVLDLLRMHPRALPSKVEIRPTKPPKK